MQWSCMQQLVGNYCLKHYMTNRFHYVTLPFDHLTLYFVVGYIRFYLIN